ncbi:MAG: phospholipase [Acidobacteria bacterium]|nr:phospholipase [Acidobacteriota bacterium]
MPLERDSAAASGKEADGVSVCSIAAEIHGRHLVARPSTGGPAPILVGFHGYAESADVQLDRLRQIPGSQRWLIVSVQALHRFYTRDRQVVASWMTSQDREAAIADNLRYVAATLASVERRWPCSTEIVFAGFSQGVSMAFRAAASLDRPARVLAVAGSLPPELDARALARLESVTFCRGSADDRYPRQDFANEQARLTSAGVSVRSVEFDGGHVWPADLGSRIAGSLHLSRP